MRYIEAKIFAGKQGIEPLISGMAALGFTEFVIEDPEEISNLLDKKHAYDWDYIDDKVLAIGEVKPNITLYFNDDEKGRESLRGIKAAFDDLKVETAIISDETWKENQKNFFRPVRVADRIIVKPTWEKYDRKQGEIVIELDPGMAFGTGMHPTTAMCMKLLEDRAGRFKSVIDIGCGSGILSITAAALGAEKVLGVDIDGEAVAVARANVEINGFSDRIHVSPGDLTEGVSIKADLVVANLVAELIITLSGDVLNYLAPGGFFISSGILVGKLKEVKASIIKAGFEISEVLEEGEWSAISARLRK